jgi:hypothetical protein
LSAHCDEDVIKYAMNHGVFQVFLPVGTTHWSQPLNNLLFVHLKQEIGMSTMSLMTQQTFTSESLFSLIDIILQAAKKAFTRKVIAHAFQETGISPLNAEKFQELA